MAAKADALAAGIDSTTDGCTVLIRVIATGRIVRRGWAAHPADPTPEQRFTAILEAITDAGLFTDVSAFAIAADAGVIALDETGHVIHAAPPADDDAHRQAAADLATELGREELAQRTGAVPAASAALVHLRWLRDHRPDVAARVDAVVQPHDWLTWRLRGFGPDGESRNGLRIEELATDRSDVSTTGWWNPYTGRNEHALFNTALGHAAIKPRIMRADGWGGEAAKMPEVGIRTGRIIGVGARRRAALVFGLGLAPGDAILVRGDAVAPVAEAAEGAKARDAGGPQREAVLCAVSADAVTDPTGTVSCFADLSGAFLPEASAGDGSPDAIAGALDALRAAGAPVTRLIVARGTIRPDGPAADTAAETAGAPAQIAGVPVVAIDVDPDAVATGVAAQAAWAISRKRVPWAALPGTYDPDAPRAPEPLLPVTLRPTPW